jgi:hypothetical protein
MQNKSKKKLLAKGRTELQSVSMMHFCNSLGKVVNVFARVYGNDSINSSFRNGAKQLNV